MSASDGRQRGSHPHVDPRGRRPPISAELAGPLFPHGVPIYSEDELAALVARFQIRQVVFSCSDVSYDHVMHRGAVANTAGTDVTLLGPRATRIESRKPVIVVSAVRTGPGKSQTRLIVEAASPVTADHPEIITDRRVLVVEDSPTLTHGGVRFGAGTVMARKFGASEIVDPRPFAVGSIATRTEAIRRSVLSSPP